MFALGPPTDDVCLCVSFFSLSGKGEFFFR